VGGGGGGGGEGCAYSENRKQDTNTRVIKHEYFKFIMVYVFGVEVYVVGLYYMYIHGQFAPGECLLIFRSEFFWFCLLAYRLNYA